MGEQDQTHSLLGSAVRAVPPWRGRAATLPGPGHVADAERSRVAPASPPTLVLDARFADAALGGARLLAIGAFGGAALFVAGLFVGLFATRLL